MQFTFKRIENTENGREIVGISYHGKVIRYPYNGSEDMELLTMLENCQVIFDENRKIITSAWSSKGQRIYSVRSSNEDINKLR